MRRIVILQDTRNSHAEEAPFPWDQLSELKRRIRTAMTKGTLPQPSGTDGTHQNPLIIALELSLAHGREAVNSAVGLDVDEIKLACDSHREKRSTDTVLINRLRKANHKVALFDGHYFDLDTQSWTKDTSLGNFERGANTVAELMTEIECDAMVLDLDFFGRPDFGRIVLSHLDARKAIPSGFRCAVYSKFLSEPPNTPADFSAKFPTIEFCFVDRFAGGNPTPIEKVISFLSK